MYYDLNKSAEVAKERTRSPHVHSGLLSASTYMPPSLALLCALLATATALDAKWTPNGDGPSRFSKRYRDAAGIGAAAPRARWPQVSPSPVLAHALPC